MSHQFKPGDLALTLVPDAVVAQGSQVEIVKGIAKGETLNIKGRPSFIAPTAGWFVTCASVSQKMTAYGDGELMPLSGKFEPEQLKAREVEPCV